MGPSLQGEGAPLRARVRSGFRKVRLNRAGPPFVPERRQDVAPADPTRTVVAATASPFVRGSAVSRHG